MSDDTVTGADPWQQLGETPFVSLATFRRSGEAVATPVWIAVDGDELVVTTNRSTGKVKRLRNDARVAMTPCSRRGAVAEGAMTVSGSAGIAGPDGDHRSATAALERKYGWQYRLAMVFERLAQRVRRQPADRVIIRISRG